MCLANSALTKMAPLAWERGAKCGASSSPPLSISAQYFNMDFNADFEKELPRIEQIVRAVTAEIDRVFGESHYF